MLSTDSTDWLLGGSLTLRNGSTDKLQFDEGHCQASRLSGKAGNDRDTFTFYYFDRDHLGSVRQVIEAEGAGVGAVLQRLSYYPSGLQLCYGSGTDSDFQGLRYSGKELDKMHGLNTYDFGARQYDPVTMRWDRMDPLCEKYYSVSPYAYCMNNPMRFVDPDGRKIIPVLYRENKKDVLIPEYNMSMSSFIQAMEQFGKTSWGCHIISSFEEKGKTHYGVQGNGKFSDIPLIIKEFNLNIKELQAMKMMSNGVKVSGSLNADKNSNGELFFELKIDASVSESAIAETIVHEFTLHGAQIDRTIDIYRKEGIDEALRFFYKTTGDQDHKKNRPLYERTKKELLQNKPEYEKAF